MKANQLIAGTVIVAGLILGATAQAQGLGGLGGHVGGALGGGAGGGMAGFNGTGGMNGAINRNSMNANADGFGNATRIHSRDVPTDTAAAAKARTGHSKIGDLGEAAPTTQGAAQHSANAGTKPVVGSEGTSAAGGARPSAKAPTTSAGTTQPAAKPSQPSPSRGEAQLAGSTNASKSGVDAGASGQGSASHGGSSLGGGASVDSSAER